MKQFLSNHRRAAPAVAIFLIAVLVLPTFQILSGGALAAPANQDGRYFPDTSHYVTGDFLKTYDALGGEPRFGRPLTEPWSDGATTFQLFENARMEQATGGAVILAPLGKMVVAGRAADAPLSVAADGPGGQYVLETGHTVREPFLSHWVNADGWWTLGKPISEAVDAGGKQTQYFEFARLIVDDRRPDGIREQLQDNVQSAASPFAAVAARQDSGSVFNAGTGHNIGGGFLEMYNSLGGAASFGAPLTEETGENGITVQYFELAKLEYYADREPGKRIIVSPLGADWLLDNTASVPATALDVQAAPVPTVEIVPTDTPAPTATPQPTAVPQVNGVPDGWQEISRGTTHFAGSTANRLTNIKLAAQKIDGTMIPAGAVFSFNRALGDDSARAGFVPSLVILGGRLVEGIGGGICQVSSTVFRAAFYAGFDIVARKNHSFRISYYEPPVGFDATVFADQGLDLKWRNNLGAPVLLKTIYNSKAATLDVVLYSTADRLYNVKLDGPYLSNTVKHGPAIYEDDPTLPAGKLVQVEYAKDGVDAVVNRQLIDKNTGKVVSTQKFSSHYVPWSDVYKRGTKR